MQFQLCYKMGPFFSCFLNLLFNWELRTWPVLLVSESIMLTMVCVYSAQRHFHLSHLCPQGICLLWRGYVPRGDALSMSCFLGNSLMRMYYFPEWTVTLLCFKTAIMQEPVSQEKSCYPTLVLAKTSYLCFEWGKSVV